MNTKSFLFIFVFSLLISSCTVGKRSESRWDLYRTKNVCQKDPSLCEFDSKTTRIGEPMKKEEY